MPGFTRRLPILYPIYKKGKKTKSARPRWKIKLGLMLYDFLAGKKGIGRHRWLTSKQVKRASPLLDQSNLAGAYLFSDGQMDDHALGLWVAEQCRDLSVSIREHTPVAALNDIGEIETSSGEKYQFDRVINVAGPWSANLLENSKVEVKQSLDLVRGSHLLLPPISKFGHLLEVPNESRVIFVLPFKHQTLVGTTECRQSIHEPIKCSEEERDYLLGVYNEYFQAKCSSEQIVATFAGLRPLLSGSETASKASREYRIIKQNQLISVFGGKWTTARALARAVAKQL